MAERAAKTIDERFDDVSQALRVGALEGKVEGLETSMNRRFTHHELLLTGILNEVKKR